MRGLPGVRFLGRRFAVVTLSGRSGTKARGGPEAVPPPRHPSHGGAPVGGAYPRRCRISIIAGHTAPAARVRQVAAPGIRPPRPRRFR